MSDSVAIDAKRILLRYGAPISVLSGIEDPERIELARLVSRTEVPDRGQRLQQLLVERGYLDPAAITPVKKGRRRGR